MNPITYFKMRQNLITTSFQWVLVGLIILFSASTAFPETAREIDVSVDVALERFNKEIPGADNFIKRAYGVLVFPRVIKAGFIVGGEYGEGALRVNGKTMQYYNTIAASFGFQAGVQEKTIILIFIKESALRQFRRSEGWKAGVDGSVALISVGRGDSLDTMNIKHPIVAFVISQKGLMFNLTLEGTKFNKLKPEK